MKLYHFNLILLFNEEEFIKNKKSLSRWQSEYLFLFFLSTDMTSNKTKWTHKGINPTKNVGEGNMHHFTCSIELFLLETHTHTNNSIKICWGLVTNEAEMRRIKSRLL